MKIDGEDVVEVDINATYISIMHGIKQQPLPTREDIYAIGDLPREVVKMWFTICFGFGGFPKNGNQGRLKNLSRNVLSTSLGLLQGQSKK